MIAGATEAWRPLAPAAEDVARIPAQVREHALVMRRLSLRARELRKDWYRLRDACKAGEPFVSPVVAVATARMWAAELALEQAAARFRAQLAENNAAPVGARWSPTVLSLWARQQVQAPEKTTC